MNRISDRCKTCDEIYFLNSEKSKALETKIFVKISQYCWPIGKRKIKGKQKSTMTSKAYDLNYCPTCGAKIDYRRVY